MGERVGLLVVIVNGDGIELALLQFDVGAHEKEVASSAFTVKSVQLSSSAQVKEQSPNPQSTMTFPLNSVTYFL